MRRNPHIAREEDVQEIEAFWIRAILYKLIYSTCGLVIGLACSIGGIVIFLSKVAWAASDVSIENKLINTAPWTVLFIMGFLIVIFTSRGLRQIEAPPEITSERFWKRLNTFVLIYSTCGLISGAGCIIGGVVLALRAIAGSIGGTQFIINNVMGAILFLVGSFVILLTRYNVMSKRQAMFP